MLPTLVFLILLLSLFIIRAAQSSASLCLFFLKDVLAPEILPLFLKRGSVLSGTGVQMGKAAMRRCSHVRQASERLCSPPQKPLWASLSSRGKVIYHIIPHCCAPSHCLAIQMASVLPGEGLPHGGQLKGPVRGSCWIQEMQGGRNASSHCPKPHAV